MNTAENINIPLELNVKFMAIFVSLFESEIVFTFFDVQKSMMKYCKQPE